MKTILSVALVLALCGVVRAADDKKADEKKAADPVGTWKCEYEIGGQPRTATLTITRDKDAAAADKDKLAGTMSWPDQKETKLKDVKWKDGELTFSAEREIGENKFNVEYTFKVDGDKLKGKGAVENAGQKTEFDITGKREKAKEK